MSDVLLERLAVAAEGILAHLKGKPAAGAATPAAGANKPAAGAAATKPAAGAAAATKPAAGAATKPAAGAANKPANVAAGTKGPGGKYTVEQVRELIRKVATDPGLGKQSAADILDQDGGGVARVTDLKPENYDKVFEACQVLLNSGEASATGTAPAEDDLM